ncbi:MAG: FlaG family protein [Helicobacter sp.]|uniref:FlaG family protein n=1 Tax=Helicobacter sp. 10-6591 TaxID=2004998 RepID=UPI0026D79FDA|nr:FlaG family protein [Helicobacter sp.]
MGIMINDLKTAQTRLVDMVKAMPDGKQTKVQPSVQDIVESQANKENRKQLEAELIELSQKLNEEMRRIGTSISFSYNEALAGLTVTVKEYGGEKIIREIPSKEAIELMKRMREVVGVIFDKKG